MRNQTGKEHDGDEIKDYEGADHLHNLISILGGGTSLMFFLTAFYDEGGTDAASITGGVSGFAMESDKWVGFSQDWDHALGQAPVIEYFHAVEANNRTYQFEEWSKSDRDTKVIALLDVICKWKPIALPQTVDKAALRKLVSLYPHAEVPDDPYVFCLSYQFLECADLVSLYPIGTVISIVVENNKQMRQATNEGYDHALKQLPRLKRTLADNILFGDKKKIKPLQAADLLTYEANKNFAKRIANPKCDLRPPIKKIFEVCKHRGVAWDKNLLEYAFKLMESMTDEDRLKYLAEMEAQDETWKRRV